MNQNSSSTENWITVKEINNSIITLDNKKLVSGIKVLPRNIFIMDEISQNRVLDELRKFYNQIDFEFWLIVADRPTNIDLYVSQLELQLNNVSRPAIRKLLVDDIEKADSFVQNDVVDTEYFILFKADTADEVTKNIRSLISNLANSGLIGTQVSDDDLRMLLDNFLNGGQTFTERTVTVE
jgi:hypothetical protein